MLDRRAGGGKTTRRLALGPKCFFFVLSNVRWRELWGVGASVDVGNSPRQIALKIGTLRTHGACVAVCRGLGCRFWMPWHSISDRPKPLQKSRADVILASVCHWASAEGKHLPVSSAAAVDPVRIAAGIFCLVIVIPLRVPLFHNLPPLPSFSRTRAGPAIARPDVLAVILTIMSLRITLSSCPR